MKTQEDYPNTENCGKERPEDSSILAQLLFHSASLNTLEQFQGV